MKNKDDILKKYSIKCNIILSVIFSILLNVTIYIISLIIKNHIFLNTYNWISFKYFLINFNNNSFTIYNTVIVSFIALYATVMAISSNLSQEFPFEIALKYIIKSNASLFYSFSIISNIVLVYIIPKNLLQVIFILGSIFLFIGYTIIYLFIFFNKFKIEKYIVYFISPKIEEFNDVRNCCKKCNIDGIKIVEDKETVFISSAIYEVTSRKNFNKVKKNEIWFKRGLLKVDNWDFLKKIENKFWIQLKKYDLENYLFPNKATIKIVINNENKKDEEFVAIDKILHNNIKYEFLNLDEFESVYEKLKRINQEERFISFSKKIIDNYFDNVYDKNLFYSFFSEYFEKNSIDKIGDPLEYEFDRVITQFYLQQNEYYSSPKIISNIQKKLMKIIYKAFKYKNKKVCMNSGLYIKELTGYNYKNKFEKSLDINWINEYNYLMQICLGNFMNVLINIVHSDFESEFKIKCLKDNINTYLDFFDLEFSSNYNYYTNDADINNHKKAILENLSRIYKINLFKIMFHILYKIQESDLAKSFFNIANSLFKLKILKNNFEKYLVYESNEYEELKDEFDVYIFDEIRDSSVWTGENNVDLIHFLFILLFNGYLNDVRKKIDMNVFSREYFSDNLLINELNNFTEGYARKFFDFESTDFENFKEKFEENIQNKIETTVSELNDYLSTPLENEEKFDFKKLEKCINEEFDLKEKRNKELLEYEYISEIGNENNFEEKIIYNMNFKKEWFLEPFFKNKEIFFSSDYFSDKEIGMEKLRKIINFIIDKVENESENDAVRINEDNFVGKIDEFTSENYKYILFSSKRLFGFLRKTHPKNIKSDNPLIYYNFEINNKSILVIENICNDKNVLYSKDSFSLHQHLYTDEKPIEFMYSEISDNDINKKAGKTNQEIPADQYRKYLKIKIKVKENYEIICNDLKNTWLLELIFD